MTWLLLVPAYLLGTFPSAVMVARSKGVDITKVGSGNPGASNIARTFGTAWGVLVFVLDGLKGAIPVGVSLLVTDEHPAPLSYAMAAAAVLGHMFPVTRNFRGGKGVATVGGAIVILQPLLFAALTVIWLAVRKGTGKASLASLLVTVGFPVGLAIIGRPGWEVAAAGALGVLVMLRHLDNIKRLVGGRELSASHSK